MKLNFVLWSFNPIGIISMNKTYNKLPVETANNEPIKTGDNDIEVMKYPINAKMKAGKALKVVIIAENALELLWSLKELYIV